MEIFKMRESWPDFSGRLRTRFSKLTGDDVLYVEGKEEETLKRISDRLGKSRAEVVTLFKTIRLSEN
jgi:uncharacterized protein YjbJ (UPF0337 family)